MTLLAATRSRLQRSIDLYQELVAEIPESSLAEKLPQLPSNTLGQQLWCVVGARESYSRAIEAGEWLGFACSLEQAHAREDVAQALSASGTALMESISRNDSPTQTQCELILDLLEHEAAHQGQLIRYLYGLRIPIPVGWKSRYALQ